MNNYIFPEELDNFQVGRAEVIITVTSGGEPCGQNAKAHSSSVGYLYSNGIETYLTDIGEHFAKAKVYSSVLYLYQNHTSTSSINSSISSLNDRISTIEAYVGTLTTNLNNYVKTDDLSDTMENINASINRIDSSLDYLDESLCCSNIFSQY